MKRVLLDTNVVLDFLLDRAPFAEAAAEVWEANRQGRIEIYVSAITPVNVFYAKALIPVYSPSESLSMLSTTDDGNGLN
jgi:predicted nucleic acid-binding protein